MNRFWSDRFLDTENEWAKHVRVLTVLPEIFINGSSLPRLAEYQSSEEAARMAFEGMEKAQVHSSIINMRKRCHRAPAEAPTRTALAVTSPPWQRASACPRASCTRKDHNEPLRGIYNVPAGLCQRSWRARLFLFFSFFILDKIPRTVCPSSWGLWYSTKARCQQDQPRLWAWH